MELTPNDTFVSKQEMIDAITKYAATIHFKFDIVESPRTLTFTCKGRKEFNCDASIVTCYKKKENKFVIKRMKMVHKCPIANNEFASTDDFLKNEIMTNINNYNNIRVGEIVNILYSRNIRVSYSSVYNIVINGNKNENELNFFNGECFNKDEIYKYFINDESMNKSSREEHKEITNEFNNGIFESGSFHIENNFEQNTEIFFNKYNNISNNQDEKYSEIKNNKDTLFKKFNDQNHMIENFCLEMKTLNPNMYVCFYGKMIFFKYPPYLEILYPIIEIKYYKRKNGIVIYGVLYDPVFEPVIYSCVVSDDINDEASLKYFLHHTNFARYICEYDNFIIQGCKEANVEFFVKTRDICKFVSNKCDNDIQFIRLMWNYCNGGSLNEIDVYNSRISGEIDKGNEIVNNENISESSNKNNNDIINMENINNTEISNFSTFEDNNKIRNFESLNNFNLERVNEKFETLSTFNNYSFNRTINSNETKYNLKLDMIKNESKTFREEESTFKEEKLIFNKKNNINVSEELNDSLNKTIDSISTNNSIVSKDNATSTPNISVNTQTNKKITLKDLNLYSSKLNLEEKNYIKPKFSFPLLNINNLPECDLDFISYGVYELPVLECLNTIQKLSLDNLKVKKRFVKTDTKSLFGYNVTSKVERNMVTETKEDCVVDLNSYTCTCNLYQELLIPCVHVCKVLGEQRIDPYLYVSNIYSKEQYSKLNEIIPVMNVNVKVQSDRFFIKKGPGRPKKNCNQEIVVD